MNPFEQAALREIQEEVGINKVQLHPICQYWVSPGGTNERMHLYCGITNLLGLDGELGMNEQSEDIFLHIVPQDDIPLCMKAGQCDNAATTNFFDVATKKFRRFYINIFLSMLV